MSLTKRRLESLSEEEQNAIVGPIDYPIDFDGCEPFEAVPMDELSIARYVEPTTETRMVTIPACQEHAGHHYIVVTVSWRCPVCGGPRGEVFATQSFDGSRRLDVDGWRNPCGHIDTYAAIRSEAGLR